MAAEINKAAKILLHMKNSKKIKRYMFAGGQEVDILILKNIFCLILNYIEDTYRCGWSYIQIDLESYEFEYSNNNQNTICGHIDMETNCVIVYVQGIIFDKNRIL
jgi:hypothetical protein